MQKNLSQLFLLAMVALLSLLLCACQSKSPSPSGAGTSTLAPKGASSSLGSSGAADMTGASLPSTTLVGVVPFSQPTSAGQLIAGSIPYDQERIAPDQLRNAGKMLHSSLKASRRNYKEIPLPVGLNATSLLTAPSPAALPLWLAYGEQNKVDFLLVPQILHWHQREGGRVGVKSSAHVRAEFFLIDVRNQRVFRRSIFDEKQVGLAEDLTKLGSFFQRGGSWITAEEMTQEAINQAIKEMRL